MRAHEPLWKLPAELHQQQISYNCERILCEYFGKHDWITLIHLSCDFIRTFGGTHSFVATIEKHLFHISYIGRLHTHEILHDNTFSLLIQFHETLIM